MTRCNAKSKQSGEQCKQAVVTGMTKCRFHGGLSLSGPASATFKHGRYSKVLPTRLLERYQQALDDPDLLAMNHEIALIDTRLQELVALDEAVEPDVLHARWEAVVDLVEQRRKLVESERKRMIDLQQVVTAGEAVALVAQLLDVVRRHVTDRQILSAIGREFGALLARDDRRRLNAPPG